MVSTSSNAAAKLLKTELAAQIIAIDEVTQDTELGTLLPVIQNIDSVKSVILVGDAAQLGPTVVSRFQVQPETKKPLNIFAEPMNKALVERMFESDYPTFLLRVQFRMAAGLMDFPNRTYYKGKLVGAPSTLLSNRPLAKEAIEFLVSAYGLKQCKCPAILLNVTDGVTSSSKSKSRSNPYNVVQAMNFIEQLLAKTSFKTDQISIITPYAAQVKTYKQAFEKARKSDFWTSRDIFEIDVKTVNDSQSTENKYIIFDLIVSAVRLGGLGFITDNKRLNVALTRPEDMHVIIRDRQCNSDEEEYQNDPEVADLQFNDEGQPIQPRTAYANNVRKIFDDYLSQQLLKTARESSSLEQVRYIGDIAAVEEFRAEFAKRACSNCGKIGHKRKDCKSEQKVPADMQCRNCEAYGHKAVNCPEKSIFHGTCLNCHQTGHRRSECPERVCNTCGEKGHTSNDCTKRVCGRCHEEGHNKKDCPRTGHYFTRSIVPSNLKEYEAAKEHGIYLDRPKAALQGPPNDDPWNQTAEEHEPSKAEWPGAEEDATSEVDVP